MGPSMGNKLCSPTSISQFVTPYMCATITPIEATIIVLVQGALQQSCDCGPKEFCSVIVLL